MRPPPLGPVNFSFFGATEAVAISHHPSLQPARQTPPRVPLVPPAVPPCSLHPWKIPGSKMVAGGQGAQRGRQHPATGSSCPENPDHASARAAGTVPLAGVTRGDATGWASWAGQGGWDKRGWSPVAPLLQSWDGRASQGHAGERWQSH